MAGARPGTWPLRGVGGRGGAGRGAAGQGGGLLFPSTNVSPASRAEVPRLGQRVGGSSTGGTPEKELLADLKGTRS